MAVDDPSDGAIRQGEPAYRSDPARQALATLGDQKAFATRSVAITVLLVGISQLLLLAWFGTMLFLVPPFERDLLDLKVKLPYVTELTIAGSRWTVKYSYVALAGLGEVFVCRPRRTRREWRDLLPGAASHWQ